MGDRRPQLRREETRALLKGEIPGVFAPPAMAIAHQLIKTWSEQD